MNGIESIAAERKRQIESEGWTTEHDSEHTGGSLADVAACYANPFVLRINGLGIKTERPAPENERSLREIPFGWPASWDVNWWKPTDRRRDLVKAGALIAAEIDRLDRADEQST